MDRFKVLNDNKHRVNLVKKRILYVDDDNDSCEMISALLGMLGYEVIQARDSVEGLTKAESDGVDLCLLDNWLPDGSGIELCRQIHSLKPQIPIVFYSGAAYESDKEAAISAGAQAYLVKPTDIDVIEQTLSMLFDNGANCPASTARTDIRDQTLNVIKEARRQWTEHSKTRIERSRKLAKEARERIDRSASRIEQTLSMYDQSKP